MNASPNESPESPKSSRNDRASKPSAAESVRGVESKLKEAQASLMDAEGRLMSAGAAPKPVGDEKESSGARGAGSDSATPAPSDRSTRAEGDSREDSKKEREPVGERLESAAEDLSEERESDPPSEPLTEHLSENVAGMLCYLFGWVSGIVFLLIDRRPFVRFHAAQSVAVFAALSLLLLALSGFFLGALVPSMAGALLALRRILELVWLAATVVLMLKAAGGERYRVAGAARYAEKAASSAR